MILDSPIISGSLTQQAGQTAEIPRYTAVSSSFLAASASFDARIDSIESTTASFSPRINALESFTASANATYVNASGDSMSGGLTITGSLIVTDRITAQEFHTEYVSSSVVFQSGSTKFGDTGDDRHSFTGSLEVSGNVLANNLNGIFSSSAQLTGSLGNYYIVSGTITQTTWDNIANKPGGIVSGSQQLTSSYDQRYVISGSITQTTWDNIANKPGGIVSGSEQVTSSLDVRYRLVGAQVAYSDISNRPTLISSSAQFITPADSFTGSFSGSFAGNGSLLTGLAAGAKFHTQSTPASTWTFVHNLSTQYPNVTVYGSNNNIILPQSITATNADTLVLEFGVPVAGYATAGIGGVIEVNGRTIKQYFTSSLSWRFEHNFGDRFASIQTYDANYEKIIPQTIALTDTTSSVITFPEATEGWAVGTIGGDLPSISSSYGGYVLQVSAGAPYTASWTAAANVVVTNSLTASYLNPISQSLIPAISGTYDLGSPTKPWRHIYVGSGSIYLVDTTGNVVKTLTGDSIVTNDNLSSLNAFTASNFTTNTFTSSATARLNSIEIVSASNISRISALETKSASVDTTNTTQNARLSALESTSASVDTLNTSQNTRLTSLEIKTGSLATTGSNFFNGTQTITGSLYISADLIVQGTSSIQNITGSAINIGTNMINLNTATPAVRYAGIAVQDSGSSAGVTGSILWDSLCNRWMYSNPSTVGYSGGIIMSGPRAATLGTETTLTCNYIAKSGGGDHLYDSSIIDDGTTVCVNATLKASGQVCGVMGNFSCGGIGTITPSNGKFEVQQTACSPGLWVQTGGTTTSYCIASFRTGTNLAALEIYGNGTSVFGNNICANVNSNTFGTAAATGRAIVVQAGSTNQAIQFKNCWGGDGTLYACGNATALHYVFNTYSCSDVLFIANGGNIGIGINNPSSALHMKGSITFTENGYDSVRMHTITHSHSDGSSCSNYISFNVSDGAGVGAVTAERMRISGTGILLVNGAIRSHDAVCYYATVDYLGGAYHEMLSPIGETADNFVFNICGAGSSTTGNCFIFKTQAGNTTPSQVLGINKNGVAIFSNNVCTTGGTFFSNVGATTSTYGFTHCGASRWGRFGMPNTSFMYLETNADSGVYIDAQTRVAGNFCSSGQIRGYDLCATSYSFVGSMICGSNIRIGNHGFNTGYTSDGILGASATPSYIVGSGYNSGFYLGYLDNGSGLYGAAYLFSVKCTHGGGGTGTAEYDAIRMRNAESGVTPFRVTNWGNLYATSKNFRINHPLPSMSDTHHLIHTAIEGPQADLIYRGKVELVNGRAEVNIDESSRMTIGTFELLCQNVQSYTTNESGWVLIKSYVVGNILHIEAQDETTTDTISWLVIGERKDDGMKNGPITDNDGHLVVETLIPEFEL